MYGRIGLALIVGFAVGCGGSTSTKGPPKVSTEKSDEAEHKAGVVSKTPTGKIETVKPTGPKD